ncbi:Ubiquitin-conjugating enzyme E2 Z [Frankliniella fusca]|uniref:Ubiquitin-conjugating enzyme E2 Z n=1 Tax=Frankliniella fusca TaxID=407009 RepID=A0AAE1HMT6_9NEOP|nr:Ubiquitin-conjugating enzyme E2 Z [Frankliniella fusca]
MSADHNAPETIAYKRVKRDLRDILKNPPQGIFCVPADNDFMTVHCIIIGPNDTPYEKGFFYFVVSFTSEYPIKPPKVKFMTTDGGAVRFNPNLYEDGKVCLSILGTWSGPEWSPAYNLTSLLLSIQSLLSDKPYHNEPGFETERYPGDVENYNNLIRHETMRVAVCGMVSNAAGLAIPDTLLKLINKRFITYFERYQEIILQNYNLSGQKFFAAGSAAQAQHQQMVPWGPMGPAAAHAHPMYYSWPQGPMMSQQNVAVKPWEVEISDSSSDSDCFQPSQKKRKVGLQASKKKADTVKRGPGRPKKVDQEFAASLPRALDGFDHVATKSKDECKKCRIYKGTCVLRPCGHAKYCRQCVNNLREESINMRRLSKCLNDNCCCLVSGWLLLINVSA